MPDKKEYTGKNLINSSCFVHFILNVKIPDIEKLCLRIDEIIIENPEFCTKENFKCMSSAAAALAVFEMFRNKGCSYAQAYLNTAQPLWEYCSTPAYRVYKKTKSGKAFNKLSSRVLGILDSLSDSWEAEITENSKERIRLSCTRCLYNSFFEKYYLKDIAAMFCCAENIIFGSMKSISFEITDTLILNDRPCEITFCSTKAT